ncbi:MAG: metallophosphoesterase [Phycisphaerae bacterium]|nr:metallophosphoesterase [Phycisphaerae bacterium]
MLLGTGSIAAGVGLYAWRVEPRWVEVTTVNLPVPRLGPELIGYRIAHVSDLHVGYRVSVSYLEQCMDRINEIAPDLVVVTGDLITGGLSDEIPTAARLLSRLNPPDGLVVSLGNHDYSSWTPGNIRYDVANKVVSAVRQIGGKVLRNERTVLRRGPSTAYLIGLDDLFVDRCDPAPAFHGLTKGPPVIALSHNPDSMGILRHWPVDVVLSGHTHGGQVRLPLLGPPILPVADRRFAAGLVRLGDKTVYVTRGLGHLLQVRFNCRPEITVHRLCPA